jgi:hypothetical protein
MLALLEPEFPELVHVAATLAADRPDSYTSITRTRGSLGARPVHHPGALMAFASVPLSEPR